MWRATCKASAMEHRAQPEGSSERPAEGQTITPEPPGPGADGRPAPRWRRRLVYAGAALLGLLVLLAVLGELLLPGIAAQRAREVLGRYGHVEKVEVKASPALALLFGEAQSVSVRAGSLTASPQQLIALEQEASGVSSGLIETPALTLPLPAPLSGTVTLHHVSLSKHGAQLETVGRVGAGDVHATLPAGALIEHIGVLEGEPEIAGSAGLPGVRIAGGVLLGAEGGRIVGTPVGIPLASLARFTLLADPRVYFESVSAQEANGEVMVSVRARALP